jgi:hypothetical protein
MYTLKLIPILLAIAIRCGSEAIETSIEKLKAVLPKFVQRWAEAQNSLFAEKPTENWKEDLEDYYKQIWNDLPTELQEKISEKAQEKHESSFETVDFKDKLILLRSLSDEKVEGLEFHEFIRASLAKFPQNKRDNLIKAALSFQGENTLWEMMSSPILEKLDFLLESSARAFIDSLKDSRISYLGRGSMGVGFCINIGGNKFTLKVPNAPEDRSNFKSFIYEQKQLSKYEAILKKFSEQNPPEQDFIPRLVLDSNNRYIGIPDKVIVTKFFEGGKIILSDSNETDVREGRKTLTNEASEQFLRTGVDDEFLVDFLGFYTRFAKEGADLNDISPWNYLHNGASFSLFELAGFDPRSSSSDFIKDLSAKIKQNPEAACIFSMLTSISTLEHKTMGSFQRNLIREKADELFGIKSEEQFFGHKVGQFVRVMQKSVRKGVISLEDLQKGFKDLEALLKDETDKSYFRLTDRGINYFNHLNNFVHDDSFMNQVIA